MNLADLLLIAFFLLLGILIFLVLAPVIYNITSKRKDSARLSKNISAKRGTIAPVQTPPVLAHSTGEVRDLNGSSQSSNTVINTKPKQGTPAPSTSVPKQGKKFEILNDSNLDSSSKPTKKDWSSNWQ